MRTFQRFVAILTFLSYGGGLLSPAYASQTLVLSPEEALFSPRKIGPHLGPAALSIKKAREKIVLPTFHKLDISVSMGLDGSPTIILDYDGLRWERGF